MGAFRNRRGQLVIPTLFIFPSFMLFVFLIFETAKLSREKIRHQFAVDAAAFVEMTNYSDFLNRTAYVNGAFPFRIFEEGFSDVPIDCDKKNVCPVPAVPSKMLHDIFYMNGAYPRTAGSNMDLDESEEWVIRYGGTGDANGNGKNSSPPNMQGSEGKPGVFSIIPQSLPGGKPEPWHGEGGGAREWWINWDDANRIFKLYVQIWQLLGSVEEAQHSVLERLTKKHNFFKKSYWLNTGDPVATAELGAQTFKMAASSFKAQAYCHQKVMFYGNKPTGSTFQPWKEWGPSAPIATPYYDKCARGPGLFQIMWVDGVKNMRKPSGSPYPGYSITQPWTAPKNYFDHNFNEGVPGLNYRKPEVHATVSCGVNNPDAAVWPNPTPKFQVRLYP